MVRDIAGQRLRWAAPFGHSPETNAALAAGRPFPVYAGWGGMARVAAQPFADGLRFRTHLEGECRARRVWGGGGEEAMLCVRNPTRPSPYKCMLSFAAVPLSPHNLLTPRPAPQITHSECSLLCDDLHRLGYRRILLDPSARVSYNMPTAWVLHSGAANLSALAALGTAPFSDVMKSSGGAAAAAGGAGYGAGVDWGADANIPAYSQVRAGAV